MTPHATHTSSRSPSITPSKRDPIADWLDVFIRMLSLKPTDSQSVRDELEDHLRSRVDDLLITGSSEHDAVLQAVSELGETADLARRFKHASHPSRRRNLMSTALIALAGSAITLGAFTAINPPAAISTNAGLAGGAAAFVAPPGIAAPFDETLKQYDISVFYAEDLYGLWGEMQSHQRTEQVVETIWQLVTPDHWEANGGDQSSVLITGSTMFIRGPVESHAGAQWVLETLMDDLDKERQAYLNEIERERAEGIDRFNAHRASSEQMQAERDKKRAFEQAANENRRREQIEVLSIQYQELSGRYIELTHQLARLDLDSEHDGQLWDTIHDRANVEFAGQSHRLQTESSQVSQDLRNARIQLGILKNKDSVNAETVEQFEQSIKELTEQQEVNRERYTILNEKISAFASRDREQLTERLATMHAREAEVRLGYEDTQVRLDRIRSLLLDLELADFGSASAGAVSYVPGNTLPFAIATLPGDRLPVGNEILPGARLPAGNETLPGDWLPAGNETLPGDWLPAGNETLPGDRLPAGSETLPGDRLPAGNETLPRDRLPAGSETLPGDRLPAGSETLPEGSGSR